ncbi:G-protein coupled receptor 55-like [Astyanax mexicanus]|uniref:G protein-coupled receptor 55 n=1 Tax=Astyanax mexicanus TaxID=7994 RepID=A0A8B9JK18_ASTMX|nr:G-protein coupled receptor 55-like [Astyanax mexicanus]
MGFNCSAVENDSHADLRLFQRVAYMLVFTVGLPLNISALWFFSRIQHWTDTHVYMANLMLADVLLILFLPFRIFQTFCPIDPSALCTFLICVHYSNMYVSIFTIMVISAHRLAVIRFPLLARALQTRRKTMARVVCLFIWVFVIAICAGFSSNMFPKKLRECYERKHEHLLDFPFLLVLEIVGYLLPVAIVTTCSGQAICLLNKSTENQLQHAERKHVLERKRVVAIITANLIIFLVCFSPIHLAHLLKYLKSGKSVLFTDAFYEVSEWIATTNCCLDAVGYYFLLKKVFKGKT